MKSAIFSSGILSVLEGLMEAWNDMFCVRRLPFSYCSKVFIGCLGSAILEEKITEAFPSATFFSL